MGEACASKLPRERQTKTYNPGEAKPGNQFIIRRKAFATLQKALQDKGVELSNPTMGVLPS